MKTPLFLFFLLALLYDPALACDNSDLTPTAENSKATTVKPAPRTAASAPTATPPTAKPRSTPGSRRPAYLFM